jgi:hypothetical protein
MSVIVLLLTVALCAPIVAASTLPDPTWIGGFYDDADEDALLALVWDQSPGLTPAVLPLATFESYVSHARAGRRFGDEPARPPRRLPRSSDPLTASRPRSNGSPGLPDGERRIHVYVRLESVE